MSVERIKNMKETLMSCVEKQMTNLQNVDTHELGEAIDMIKDLAEAAYYCAVTEAMETKTKDNQWQSESRNFYDGNWGEKYYQPQPIVYMGPDTHGNIGDNKYYDDGINSLDHTHMNGISQASRKMYMEAKSSHKGNAIQMQELEKYMKDLSKDVTDMIEGASPEERLLLQQKLITLANKIKPIADISN